MIRLKLSKWEMQGENNNILESSNKRNLDLSINTLFYLQSYGFIQFNQYNFNQCQIMETTFEFFRSNNIYSIFQSYSTYFILLSITIFNFLYFTPFYCSQPLLLYVNWLRILRRFLSLLYFLITNMTEKYKEEISPDKMLKQAQKTKGYLLKKSSGIITSWNQRYFIILNGALAYYGDQALEKQKGQIKIKDIQSIVMKGNDSFNIQTPKRQYQFKCPKQQDRDLWVASLNLLKEYSSDGEFTNKIIVKRALLENKGDQLQFCKIEDVRKVLNIMKLTLLAEQLEQSRICQRIYCQKLVDGFLISISVKCLQFTEIDEQILAQNYISPYNFNKLYKIYFDGRIQDIAKMSTMQSLKSQDGSVYISFPDKKKAIIPYKNEKEAQYITRKLYRCYEVAKEYYNPFKIVLKKNIDRMAYLYDNFRQLFQQQTIYRVNSFLKRYINCSSDMATNFIKDFKFIKKDLIETQQACKVTSPARDDIKCAYFKIVHEEVRHALSRAWELLFASFQQKSLITLSSELYEYWVIVNQVVADSSLIQGCYDLNRFFMGRAGQSIKQKIHSFNAQKVQYYKMKSEPIGNQLTMVFYQWLKEVNSCLTETVPLQAIFDQYCKFYSKCFDQFAQFLSEVSEKWNQILVIIGACNDLIRIRNYIKTNISSEICKGIFAEKKFYTACGNQITKKINQSMSNLIKKAFIIFFRNIDKKLLTRPFLETDFSKICYQVLQRLELYKSRLLQQAEYEMLILSFDQICFFFYTILINKNVPLIKNVRQYYIKAIEKGLTEIEQFYCNIKTENYVKSYLQQVLKLKQILICNQASISKVSSELHHTFGTSFNEECILTILTIREVGENEFKILFQLCKQGLSKSSSSQDSQSCIQMQMRSRKSTLTQSLYTISIPETNNHRSNKTVKQGYLDMKKITKGLPNFFNCYYIRIKDGHILGYSSPTSSEIIFSIDLDDVQHCYLDTQANEKCTFIIVMGSDNYYFKATTRDEAGLWIQAVYSQIKHPLFENRSQYPEKQKKNALFKNLEAELTTTASHKQKTGENGQDQKFVGLKRAKRIKEEQQKVKQKSGTKSPSKRTELKKYKSNKQKKGEDEGSCCTSTMF